MFAADPYVRIRAMETVGVATVAREATGTARQILQLREEVRGHISTSLGRRAGKGLELFDKLFDHPVVTVKSVQRLVRLSQPAAAALVTRMEEAKVLAEITGGRRNRVFSFEEYLRLFGERSDRT